MKSAQSTPMHAPGHPPVLHPLVLALVTALMSLPAPSAHATDRTPDAGSSDTQSRNRTLLAQSGTTQGSATLPQVWVRAWGEQEDPLGPIPGFRAQRATTATKTDTPLNETPQSITVIPRDQITEQGMTSLQDVLGYAAGVRSDAYGLDARTDSMRVRGADIDTYRDGLRDTYNWYTSTTRPDPYTLERIEVLRGPSGMLFGAGALGGIVNLVSKRPQFESHREVGIQLGSHQRRQVQFDLTGPFDDQLAWRLVGVVRRSDTQVDYVPDDRTLLMPSVAWHPSAATSLVLTGLWQQDKTGSTSQFFPWAGTLLPAVPGTLPTRRFIGEPGDHYDTRRQQLGWAFEHHLNDTWTVRQNYRYSRNDHDGSYHYADFWTIPGGWGEDPENQRIISRVLSDERVRNHMHLLDTSVQGKFATGNIRHTAVVGLDYTRQHENKWGDDNATSTIDAWTPLYGRFTRPTTRAAKPDTHERQLGLYLQDQLKWQQWIVVAGLRHDRTRTGDGSQTYSSHATTKRAGFMRELDGGWTPYFSYAESFRPQAPQDGQVFKPLRGQQTEIGVKYAPAGQALAINAAVYHLKEINRIVSPQPTVHTQLGKTRNHGVELEARGTVGSTDVVANYSYTSIDRELEGIPRHQFSAWGTHHFSGGREHGLSAGAGMRWMAAFHDGTGPRVPASTLFDAMVAWDATDWRMALNITNLTDKKYMATCLSRGDCWWGARRNVLATAAWKF